MNVIGKDELGLNEFEQVAKFLADSFSDTPEPGQITALGTLEGQSRYPGVVYLSQPPEGGSAQPIGEPVSFAEHSFAFAKIVASQEDGKNADSDFMDTFMESCFVGRLLLAEVMKRHYGIKDEPGIASDQSLVTSPSEVGR